MREIADRYEFNVEYDPIFDKEVARNSSTAVTEGWKKSIRFFWQNSHHNLSGLVYCDTVASEMEAMVASIASLGVPFTKNAWRIASRPPGKSCAILGEYV